MTIVATCHCGATRLEATRAPDSVTECNCTFCAKRGALWAYYRPEEVRVLSEDSGGVYSARGFNQHHFCTVCGCGTYGEGAEWSRETMQPIGKQIQINARLFDDFDLGAVLVQTIDGRHLW